jgi:hypothetical protein
MKIQANRANHLVARMGFEARHDWAKGGDKMYQPFFTGIQPTLQQIRNCFSGKRITPEEMFSALSMLASRKNQKWLIELDVISEYSTGVEKVRSMEFETSEACQINQLRDFYEDQQEELKAEIGRNEAYKGTNWKATPIRLQ